MSTSAVALRLAWVKDWQAARSREHNEMNRLNDDAGR